MTEGEFSAWWELLCERFGRTPSAPLTRIYAQIVKGEKLTAAQWGAAVTAAVRFDDFMPSPQRLVNLARGGQDFAALALSEWDACLERARLGEAATMPGTLTRTLMNRVTNGVPLGQVDASRLDWLKKEFVRRYGDELAKEASANTPALLPARPTPRVLT